MSKRIKRIEKDFRSVQRRANALYGVYTKDVGQIIAEAYKDTLSIVSHSLAPYPEISFSIIRSNGVSDHIERAIRSRWMLAAHVIEDYWAEKGAMFDLMSRLAVSYVSKKASPPWAKTKLDLSTKVSKDGATDPRKGHIRFYFSQMCDEIMKQIGRGALNEESLSQILMRVRKMFDRGKLRRPSKEAKFNHTQDEGRDVYKMESDQLDISEGIYTLEDVDGFIDDMRRANQWEYRQYRPWFSETLKKQNRYLRDLDKLMAASAMESLHQGMVTIGDSSMGIEDFQWVTAKMERTCEYCNARDGMTMTEIADQINDDYGDEPPPLHPNCVASSTIISAQGISKKFERWFSGKAVTIRVQGHDDLTITMNHPVLTDRGWVPAGELKKSDKLVASRNDQAIIDLLGPNHQEVKTTIKDLSAANFVAGPVLTARMPVSAKDFHGDGVVDTEVNIVLSNSLLSDDLSDSIEKSEEGLLGFRHFWREFFQRLSFIGERMNALFSSSNCSMCGGGLSLPLLSSHVGAFNQSGFATTANRKAHSFERSLNDNMIASDTPTNIQSRLASEISFVEIDDLVIGEFSGHVYNLETKDGFYLANGLIVHNCNCALVPKIQDDWADKQVKDGDETWDSDTGVVYNASGQEQDYGINDMTFDEYLDSIPGVGE